jgi:hypothetical protein
MRWALMASVCCRGRAQVEQKVRELVDGVLQAQGLREGYDFMDQQ